MIVALTGASGFIGRALTERLRTAGHEVLPLSLRRSEPVPACDAVVNLAGEPVVQRWNEAAKRRIRESRAEGTRRLVAEIAARAERPQTLVSASAVGYYGSRGDEILTESSPQGTGFLAEVCAQWEEAANEGRALGMRIVKLRIGMVLGHGGALARMLPAFCRGAGGRLGRGTQWVSWIHLEDVLRLIEFALEESRVFGALNATAPNPVTNRQFTAALAHALHRPAIFPVPALALKLALGEVASVLLDSQRVIPRAALDRGFRFRYHEVGAALEDLLRKSEAA
jgi:uncharacterized protein (TIGR01777 family)